MHPTRSCTSILYTLNKSFLQHDYIHKNSQAPNHPKKKNRCYTRVPRNAATLGAPKLGTATLLPQTLQLPSSQVPSPQADHSSHPSFQPQWNWKLYVQSHWHQKKWRKKNIDVEWNKSYSIILKYLWILGNNQEKKGSMETPSWYFSDFRYDQPAPASTMQWGLHCHV